MSYVPPILNIQLVYFTINFFDCSFSLCIFGAIILSTPCSNFASVLSISISSVTDKFAKMASMMMLTVRKEGQGKKENKKPVLFPKVVFLYDEELHGKDGELEDLFDAGIECSKKAMYPDWLSLTGDGYVASMYKQYKRNS